MASTSRLLDYAAPAVAAGLGLPRPALGVVFSAGVLGLSLGSLLFGLLADRLGRKRTFVLCAVLFGLGSLATAGAWSLPLLEAARLAAGLGLGGATPTAIAIVADYCPKRVRPVLIVVMYTSFALGGTAAGIATSMLGRESWRVVFYVGGAAPLLLALVLGLALPEGVGFLLKQGRKARVAQILLRLDPRCCADEYSNFIDSDPHPAAPGPLALFSRERTVTTLLLWTAFFTSLVAIYSYVNWIPTLLSDFGISSARIVSIASAGQWGGIFGGLLIARLMARLRALHLITGGYLLAAIAFLVFFWAGKQYADLFLVNAFLGVCLLGTQYGINATAAQLYPPAIRGTGVGWAIGVGRLGGVLGPSLTGLLLHFGCTPAHVVGFGAIPAALAASAAYFLSVTSLRTAR